MQHAGLTIGMVAIGLGLASIGFNLNGNQANATPAAPVAFNAGPDLPTIVWYDSHLQAAPSGPGNFDTAGYLIVRAWSDGTIEQKWMTVQGSGDNGNCGRVLGGGCYETDWIVISSPNEGLNAAADINFDSRVNAEDLGIMLAAWGEAPRNDYPPSDCPLGLIP